MRKAIRIVSTLLLVYSVINAVFTIPSSIMMLSNPTDYVADLSLFSSLISSEEALLLVKTIAIIDLVQCGLSVMGMGFLVYYIRNAFVESFKGRKAMLFSIPAFIFLYFPIAIILIIYGAMTRNEAPKNLEGDGNSTI